MSENWLEQPLFIQSFAPTSLVHVSKLTDSPKIFLVDDFSVRTQDTNQSYWEITSDDYLAYISNYVVGLGPWKDIVVPVDKNYLMAPTDLVARAHAHNLQVHPYTYRNENRFLHFNFHQDPYDEYGFWINNMGVDGLFTDFTEALHRYQELISPHPKDETIVTTFPSHWGQGTGSRVEARQVLKVCLSRGRMEAAAAAAAAASTGGVFTGKGSPLLPRKWRWWDARCINQKKIAASHRRRIQVGVSSSRRRRADIQSESFVLLEPGMEEEFVSREELEDRLRGWLERWPGGELPPDLARFDTVDDAVSYLVRSVCELEIDGEVGSVQWYQGAATRRAGPGRDGRERRRGSRGRLQFCRQNQNGAGSGHCQPSFNGRPRQHGIRFLPLTIHVGPPAFSCQVLLRALAPSPRVDLTPPYIHVPPGPHWPVATPFPSPPSLSVPLLWALAGSPILGCGGLDSSTAAGGGDSKEAVRQLSTAAGVSGSESSPLVLLRTLNIPFTR
ncbi:hypothetical protein GUJ93_ZPchr0001g31219 [Zizania palustris]|uniref:GP-PDE domain-containing protein n=1 Tax=Zizania palustris TaxID=103762 RepID=A0A8J5RZT8_ZIZPA|nr:hypothetical protein GUJ93_ZPchr0001g31219 [Zizania palustris]